MTDERKNTVHLSIWLIAVLLIMAAAFAIAMSTADAQRYPGPPMWDRGPNPEYRRERQMPPPRPYGPQMGPCIYHGDCRGPRDRDFNDPRPYPMPPRREYYY